MNSVKIYLCKRCGMEKKAFVGTRREVREHLRAEHFIRGLLRAPVRRNGERQPSELTKNTISMEFNEYVNMQGK